MDYQMIFEDYIFGRIIPEMDLILESARDSRDRGDQPYGQVACTLALLAHTEFMGSILLKPERSSKGYKGHFEAFFRRLGAGYGRLLDDGHDIYEVLRHGMVHRYFANRHCTLVLFNDRSDPFAVRELEVSRPVPTGVGVVGDGDYYFVIEKYFRDFRAECERTYSNIKSQPPAQLHIFQFDGWAST